MLSEYKHPNWVLVFEIRIVEICETIDKCMHNRQYDI